MRASPTILIRRNMTEERNNLLPVPCLNGTTILQNNGSVNEISTSQSGSENQESGKNCYALFSDLIIEITIP